MERPPYLAGPPQPRRGRAGWFLASVACLLIGFAAGRLTAPRGAADARIAQFSPPATARPEAAATPAPPAASRSPSVSSEATPSVHRAVFERAVSPPPAGGPETAAPDPPPVETSLHEELVRCLVYDIEREEGRMPTEAETVRVRVTVHNRCARPFAAADSEFEVRAVSPRGRATAGRQIGRFQGTIPPLGTQETVLDIQAASGEFYRFEASPTPDAGGTRKASG